MIARITFANGFGDLVSLFSAVTPDTLPLILENIPKYASGLFISPIWEEFLFRGVLFIVVLNKFGLKTALFVTSIIFALVHIDPDSIGNMSALYISTILLVFVESVFKNWIFYKTRSLTLPIIMHIFSNIFAYALQVLYYQLGYGIL